jgi:DNA replication licensing factor MCM3
MTSSRPVLAGAWPANTLNGESELTATRTRSFTEFLDLDAGSDAAKVRSPSPPSLSRRDADQARTLNVQRMSMHYRSAVKKMLDAQERRLVVNLDDLRDFDRDFCNG